MPRQRIEYMHFSKSMIEDVVKNYAKIALIGGYYEGTIGEQEVRWCDDGSVEVFTRHTPADKVIIEGEPKSQS